MCLKLATRCNRGSIPASNQPQLAYILIEVSPDLTDKSGHLPVHPIIILDRSGPAMQDSLPAIKQALRDLVDLVQPGDYLSIVTLSGEILLTAQPVEKRAQLKRVIDNIHSIEEKRSAKSLAVALRQAYPEKTSGHMTRIVLMLGGAVDEEEQSEFLALSDQAATQQTPFIGVGVGYDWDERFLLQMIARSSGASPDSLAGEAYFVQSSEEIGEIASRLFCSLSVVARQTQVIARLVRGVEIRQVWQVLPLIKNITPTTIRDQVVTIPLGDLECDKVAFLIEVVLPPRASGIARIAQVEVNCVPEDDRPFKIETDLVVGFSMETGATNPLDCYVMDFVEIAQAYRLNCLALADIEAGNRQLAAQKFRQAAAILVSQNKTDLADRIRGEADYNLRQYGKISSEARKLILLTSRMMPRSDSADQ
jgi:hypothetical protein